MVWEPSELSPFVAPDEATQGLAYEGCESLAPDEATQGLLHEGLQLAPASPWGAGFPRHSLAPDEGTQDEGWQAAPASPESLAPDEATKGLLAADPWTLDSEPVSPASQCYDKPQAHKGTMTEQSCMEEELARLTHEAYHYREAFLRLGGSRLNTPRACARR